MVRRFTYERYGRKIVLLNVSSWEEEFASTANATQAFPHPDPNATTDDPYPCCSFRGSIVALDLKLEKNYGKPIPHQNVHRMLNRLIGILALLRGD